jgi:hypothetical protein
LFGWSVAVISIGLGWLVFRWHTRGPDDPMDELAIQPGAKNSIKKF